ncbi:MAG: ribosome biogenesis GTPase Der [Mollicutes bacterium PWAP]|nr:ribosome biogenesis GTPase Der [Mollicutes bacterium PWAP]
MKNTIAIVGRPNVGKSTLFNRLIGKRKSIVHDMPGVTRDRLYHYAKWSGINFRLVDTGGIEISDKPFQEQIGIQAKIAIEESNIIIFVVDGKNGSLPDDEYIADILRKSNKTIYVVANKVDNSKNFDLSLWSLGFADIFSISALHGNGIGNLLDIATSSFEKENKDNQLPKLSIIGKPNAGKSSLLNQLAKTERSIVSPIANTTRDSVSNNVFIEGTEYEVVDTAGINRKSRLVESVDHYALMRAMSSLEDSDIAILVVDATKDFTHFDSRIAGYAMDNKKPIIMLINKWDLVEKKTNTMIEYEKKVRKHFKFMSWAPVIFISAKFGNRLSKLEESIEMVRINKSKVINTNLLNEVIQDIQIMKPAPSKVGKRLNIKFSRQLVGTRIPTFLLFCNDKSLLHFSYERYIWNCLRDNFDLRGVPINLIFKDGKNRDKNER